MVNNKISIGAMLGFQEGPEQDWTEIRSIQLEGFNDSLKQSWMSVLFVSALTFIVLFQVLTIGFSIGWAALNMFFWGLLFVSWHQARQSVKRLEQMAFKRIGFQSLLGSISWATAYPMILYSDISLDQSMYALLALLVIANLLILSMMLTMSLTPSVAIIFIACMTLASSLSFFWIGAPLMVACTVFLGVVVAAIQLKNCEAQLRQRLSEARLRDKSETVSLLLREFEDSGADWLWQTDTARRAMHVSPRFAFAVGQDKAEIEGQPILKLIAGDSWENGNYPEELHHFAEKMKHRESFANLVVPVTLGGYQRWWELSASPRFGESGDFLGFRGVGSDVTEQCESQNKISHLARFDTLTGLPNRLQVTESLAEALLITERTQARCCFMMIDLDRFKQVNDTLGHPVGDRLLAQVSRRLQSLMRDGELCGRLGGDEFAVVLPDLRDTMRVEKLAEGIIKLVSQPYEIDQHTLYIGASIGSAVGPTDGRTVEMLMRSADLALYHSKELGRGMHNRYEPQLHSQAEERRLMEIELRTALDRDEFHIVYQPIVSATDSTLTGFEALLRWNNQRYGNVSPVKFIPLAEEARMIVPLGEWVLRHACVDAMKWPSPIKVAVNVSAEQLTNIHFVEKVVSALRDSGLPPQRLEIEVTESLFMRDGTVAVQVLDQLLALGIRLSLDDFGTGYSSLGYLRKTRFNTIKVDRSFVQGASKNIAECLAIIRAVVAMADSLGMATTAEGVETEEELRMVQSLGCSKIQGYLFGRPMPLADTLPLFTEHLSHDGRDLFRRVAMGDN